MWDTWDTPDKYFFTPVMNESHLDISRLENVRHRGSDVISACPACREQGKDSAKDNLRIYAGGPYICIAHPKDREHNRRIFALVGVHGEKSLDPVEKYRWRERRAREFQCERDVAELQATMESHREIIVARWQWDRTDVWEDSPQKIDCELVEFDPRWFLASLFPQEACVWTGEVFHSGTRYARHWRTVAEWHSAPLTSVGPMTTPAIWNSGTVSRAAVNVVATPYIVLDFDGFDGRKPKTPKEIDAHILTSLAFIRWIREGLHWELAAILFTGSVSLHAWFHSPPQDVLESLKGTAVTLGMDAGLIGHPEHPCRLPGQLHANTGGMSRCLWLQIPIP